MRKSLPLIDRSPDPLTPTGAPSDNGAKPESVSHRLHFRWKGSPVPRERSRDDRVRRVTRFRSQRHWLWADCPSPPPTQAASGSLLSSIVGKLFGTQDVVPPPPNVSSDGVSSTSRNASGGSNSALTANVIPPPPSAAGVQKMEASTERHPERAASRVILKPIDEALKNGDVIRAVIRNTGINHDGKTPGVTFPQRQSPGRIGT